jgi:L-threonylcarbamoyladenylate synthase
MIESAQNLQALDQASHLIKSGELVAIPTETVYGLGADAMNDEAVSKIYSLKGRPSSHPLIAHILSIEETVHFTSDIPKFAQNLMQSMWPGPLTLILNKKEGVANACSAGASTIALRCPSHPAAQALLSKCKALGVWAIAAPSANRFGRVSPTSALHVADEFGESLFVLDGGPCEVGIESTIIDCTRGEPIVLRPGLLTLDELSRCAEQTVVTEQAYTERLNAETNEALELIACAPKSSGSLESHYAPLARVRLMAPFEIAQNLSTAGPKLRHIGIWSQAQVLAPNSSVRVSWKRTPLSAELFAQALFAQLRAFDALGVDEIWVEKPQIGPKWAGIHDRLGRAAHAGTEPR